MICQFCHYANEDGALFCEQCKSDLAAAPTPAPAPVSPPQPSIDFVPVLSLADAPVPKPEALSDGDVIAIDLIETVPSVLPMVDVPPVVDVPPELRWSLLVLRGQRIGIDYQLFDGQNVIGRADDQPVDIDLADQEPAERTWCSRQHACVDKTAEGLFLDDLNSSNGTYLNRSRVYPGQRQQLKANDVIQIGAVQLRVSSHD